MGDQPTSASSAGHGSHRQGHCAKLEEYVAAVREAVGMEIPLSMDHLGHLGVKSIIRLGKAYEKYNLSWMEDVIPWQYTELLKQISDQSPTPILTGEDIYLKEGLRCLCQPRREQDSPGPCHLGRHSGNTQDRGYGGRLWRSHGHALCGNANMLHGKRALRCCNSEFPGHGKSFLGCALVGVMVEKESKTPIVNHGLIMCRKARPRHDPQ